MPVKQFSFRISEQAYTFIENEAKLEGVSVAQYVRESALARAWFAIGIRGDIPQDVWDSLARGRELGQL